MEGMKLCKFFLQESGPIGIFSLKIINSVIAGRNTYTLRNLNLLAGTYMMVAVQGGAIIARTKFIVAK